MNSEITQGPQEVEDKIGKVMSIVNLETNALHLIEFAKNTQIRCENTAKQGLSLALQAKKLTNQIEESRKEIVKPHIDYQKAMMKFAKDISSKLEEMQDQLQDKVYSWMKDQKDNPFTMVDKLEVEDGSLYTQSKVDYEILDPNQLPKEFLTVDVKAVENAIKNGMRNIPGVRVYQTEKSVMRIKN